MKKENYDKRFKLINLNELGKSTYNHSYNNCLRDEFIGTEKINLQIKEILSSVDDN